jgi:hypothetical protein
MFDDEQFYVTLAEPTMGSLVGWMKLGFGNTTYNAEIMAMGHVYIGTTMSETGLGSWITDSEKEGDIILETTYGGTTYIKSTWTAAGPGGSSGNQYACHIMQGGSDALEGLTPHQDVLKLDFENLEMPQAVNNWIQFVADGTSRGAIQGTTTDEMGIAGSGGFFLYSTWEALDPNDPAGPPTMGPTSTWAVGMDDPISALNEDGYYTQMTSSWGNIQIVSGNADYGEFFEVGDESEWSDCLYGSAPSGAIFGIEEGIVVWVHNRKFYRKKINGLGVPMFITKRSIAVGDGTALLKENPDDRVGEVLSFIGQLPVVISGEASVGDLVRPIDGENHCMCISKESASLQDYMSAMGTSLVSLAPIMATIVDGEELDEQSNFRKIWVAVGVK